MILAGMLLLSMLGNLFFYFDLIVPFNEVFASGMSYLVTAVIVFHIGYGYFNAFSINYSRLGIAYRIALFYVLLALEIMILFYIVFGFITNWQFGTIRVTPF